MKKIDISTSKYPNKFVLVDDEDFEYLNQWKWFYSKIGYAMRREHLGKVNGKYKSKMFCMHKLINNTPEGFETDHINRDKLDNRKHNLRTVSHQQNNINKDLQKNNTSGYTGVCWSRNNKNWEVYLKVNKKKIHLGHYKEMEKAILARKEGEKKYFGEFARQ